MRKRIYQKYDNSFFLSNGAEGGKIPSSPDKNKGGKMDNIREKMIEEIVEEELFHTYVETENGVVMTYIDEGFDKEMIEAEGSIYVVYVIDAMREYYQRHKSRIDERVNERLRDALFPSPTYQEGSDNEDRRRYRCTTDDEERGEVLGQL